MNDNIQRVLQLLQDGKITAQEAESLISALSGAPAAREAPTEMPRPIEAQRPADAGTYSTDSRISGTGGLPTGDLLLQIAEDPSISENEKITVIIHATALICTVMALQPIPGVDIFILTPIQVASVMAMSHVMGTPIGKNGAGEIVTSIVAVVGWGVVAEQFVLAGAKLFMPFFGGIVLIPLIYATVYGLGCAARAVLEARRSNRQLSDSEIRQIKEEAERRAKAEKRDWSLPGIKRELDEWRIRAETYKQYEVRYTEDQLLYERLQQEQAPLNRRLSDLTQRKTDLEQRVQEARERLMGELPDAQKAEMQIQADRLSSDLDSVNGAWQAEGAQLERKRAELDAVMLRLETLVSERFRACYPGLRFTPEAMAALIGRPYARLYLAERQISLLQHEPAKADYQDVVISDFSGVDVFSIAYDEEGRLYTSNAADAVVVRWVGSRRTQDKDIQRLRDSTL